MVRRHGRSRLRQALVLALFLLAPALLYDLSVLSKTGHTHGNGGGTTPATHQPGASSSGGALALLPFDPGALHPATGGKHWQIASATGDQDGGDADDELLQNLVYLTHGDGAGDDNKPLSDGAPDGDHGWSFGGDGGRDGGAGGSGGGGGFGGAPFGGGNDPGADVLPLAFTPGTNNKDSGDLPFPSPIPSSIAAVPEPATWALFILGFGLIGAQLRRARDARLAPVLTRNRNKRVG